jgi:maleate isomerase
MDGNGATGGAAARKVRYGWRFRLGMIIPSVNTEAEPQMEAMLPDGVSLHTTRLKMVEGPPETLLGFTDRIEEGASALADAGVDRILFHCTAVTTYEPDMGRRIRDRIGQATGLPVSVTGEAVAAALAALQARKVVMVTPYTTAVNEREAAFLRHFGVAVLRNHAEGLTYAREFRAIEPYGWYRKVMDRRSEEADAYFLSCAQIRVAEIIAALEHDVGRPVVTSNQAALWHALRQGGISDQFSGFGELFARC